MRASRDSLDGTVSIAHAATSENTRMLSSENSFTPITDALFGHKQNWADGLDGSHLEVNPKRQLSVAGHMDV